MITQFRATSIPIWNSLVSIPLLLVRNNKKNIHQFISNSRFDSEIDYFVISGEKQYTYNSSLSTQNSHCLSIWPLYSITTWPYLGLLVHTLALLAQFFFLKGLNNNTVVYTVFTDKNSAFFSLLLFFLNLHTLINFLYTVVILSTRDIFSQLDLYFR